MTVGSGAKPRVQPDITLQIWQIETEVLRIELLYPAPWRDAVLICLEQALNDIADDLKAVRDHFPADGMAKIIPYLTEVRQFLDEYRN